MSVAVDSSHETPAFFKSGEHDLFAILTRPSGESNGVAVIILTGGNVPTPSRNRTTTRIARRAAALGYHVLRFDYHGVGESTGFVENFRLDRPFTKDLDAAVEWLQSLGLNRFILIGSCFGARTALAGAGGVPGLEGVALLAPPLRDLEMGVAFKEQPISQMVKHYRQRATVKDVVKGLFRYKSRRRYFFIAKTRALALLRSLRLRLKGGRQDEFAWISRSFLESIEVVSGSRWPVLFVYGDDDDFYDDFERAKAGPLGPILGGAGDRLEVVTLRGVLHGYPSLSIQTDVIEAVDAWLARLAERDRSD